MILYQGSLEKVRKPEIREDNQILDYGSGFYTTTSKEQAILWIRRNPERKGKIGYINIYEWNEASSAQLDILPFKGPTEEWLNFVISNRTDIKFKHTYDIVWGPVPDDRVYAIFALYKEGLLSKQELIQELKTYTLVVFHTHRSLGSLSFLGAKEVFL